MSITTPGERLMLDDLIDEVDRLHQQTKSAYELVEAKLAEQLRRVRAVLAVLETQEDDAGEEPEGALPPIYEIASYLREQGKPMTQGGIVSVVGQRRKQQYPSRKKPFGDVYKSLEYHDRQEREIVCVRMDGNRIARAQRKPKPRNPRVKGGAGDKPEFYREPENLFYFKSAVTRKESGNTE